MRRIQLARVRRVNRLGRPTALLVAGGLALLVPVAVIPGQVATAADPLVVWTVGDMCDNDNGVPGCERVADLVAADTTTSYFVPMGDIQYEKPTLALFNTYYHPKVGARLNAITKPIPGNHEYTIANAGGYYAYFGARAGDPSKGYYSFTENGWKLIFLNSNCGKIADGCNYTSVQAKWLDLQLQGPESCEIVFTHHPPMSDNVSSSGTPNMKHFFRHAYENHAELVRLRSPPQLSAVLPQERGFRPCRQRSVAACLGRRRELLLLLWHHQPQRVPAEHRLRGTAAEPIPERLRGRVRQHQWRHDGLVLPDRVRPDQDDVPFGTEKDHRIRSGTRTANDTRWDVAGPGSRDASCKAAERRLHRPVR